MKYVNANEVLPEELLFMIQKYYQGGYLYIPKISACEERTKTDYKIELEMRNQYIYLKHLEGRTNGQLGQIYHLSESSIRRVTAKEKVRYQNMKENIERILPLWGMEGGQLAQIYPSAWEVNHSYVVKVYEDKKQLERNIKISEVLLRCHIPAAKAALTKTGEKYAAYQNRYFLMSKKLQGSNISDRRDQAMMRKMGCAIANLHLAFLQCEREVEFWDNSLLKEMKGWVRKSLRNNDWQIIKEEEYTKTVEQLETVYDDLPKQLIHRDVHFGNFLFSQGDFSGYIDFDLSQRNIRIFDLCYFLAGLLAEEREDVFTKSEWLAAVKSVMAGYESIISLSTEEKDAVPCVMACIEILCAAYFTDRKDIKHANDAYQVFLFVQRSESEIKNAVW